MHWGKPPSIFLDAIPGNAVHFLLGNPAKTSPGPHPAPSCHRYGKYCIAWKNSSLSP
jgi:hypothetical protein